MYEIVCNLVWTQNVDGNIKYSSSITTCLTRHTPIMHITFDILPESSFYYRSLFSYFKDPVVFLGNNVIINKTSNLAEVLENHNQENTLFCNENSFAKGSHKK